MNATLTTAPNETHCSEPSEARSRGTGDTPTPQIWVGCLACYNAGHRVGDWFDAIDAPTEMGEFDELVSIEHEEQLSHLTEGHDELWVFDHENFGGLLKGECSASEAVSLAEIIQNLQTCGYPLAAYEMYADNVGVSYASLEDFEAFYCGEYDSKTDFAQEMAQDLGFAVDTSETQWPYTCIDWNHATRELFMGDYWSAKFATGVYVFRAV